MPERNMLFQILLLVLNTHKANSIFVKSTQSQIDLFLFGWVKSSSETRCAILCKRQPGCDFIQFTASEEACYFGTLTQLDLCPATRMEPAKHFERFINLPGMKIKASCFGISSQFIFRHSRWRPLLNNIEVSGPVKNWTYWRICGLWGILPKRQKLQHVQHCKSGSWFILLDKPSLLAARIQGQLFNGVV